MGWRTVVASFFLAQPYGAFSFPGPVEPSRQWNHTSGVPLPCGRSGKDEVLPTLGAVHTQQKLVFGTDKDGRNDLVLGEVDEFVVSYPVEQLVQVGSWNDSFKNCRLL